MSAPQTEREGHHVARWQRILGWVLSLLLLVPFVPSAMMKIVQPAGFLAGWTTNFPAASARPIGVIELLNVVLFLVPRTRLLGVALITAYLGGAVSFHVHAADGMFFVPVIIGVIAWIGLWLRDPKLRRLFPLSD